MNVYQKLNAARLALQSTKLAKSGHNKFAGYKYFELGDFLPTIQTIFDHYKLCGVVSFGTETASLTIVDAEKPESTIVITSPMSSAALKGCHEVQNLGAVETYIRRYLWVTALEIVEHDALDRSKPIDESKPVELVESRKKISTSYAETLTVDRRQVLSKKAGEIAALWEETPDKALEEYVDFRDSIDVDEQAAFKHFLDEENPKLRNALLKHFKSVQVQAA